MSGLVGRLIERPPDATPAAFYLTFRHWAEVSKVKEQSQRAGGPIIAFEPFASQAHPYTQDGCVKERPVHDRRYRSALPEPADPPLSSGRPISLRGADRRLRSGAALLLGENAAGKSRRRRFVPGRVARCVSRNCQ